jgi:ribosomal protein S18 acetylase RimI-like enzyme
MDIIELKRKQYQDYELDFEYDTEEHYAVCVNSTGGGFAIELRREKMGGTVHKRFSENLFQRYLVKPSAYAVMDGGKPVAILEIDREFWNKRLKITDLVVLPEHRRKGYGAALVAKAKQIAALEGWRAVFLDTHSCNVKAIDFYLSQGFALGGIDTTYYSNTDIDRREVWIELVHLLDNPAANAWHYGDPD